MAKGFSRRDFLKGMGIAAAAGGVSLTGLTRLAKASPSRFQDLPRLVYIYPGAPQPDVQRVQDALSEYMAERIGATIELRALDWGVYNDQIGLINASAEVYDLAFTAPWINNYYNNVNQEYLVPLQDLLPSLAPSYWASMTPATWEAARVAGGIYGGINQQIFVKPFGPYIRTDILEAVGLGDEFANLTSYEDLEPLMAAIKEYVDQDDTLTHVTYNLSPLNVAENWGFDPQDALLVVRSTDENAQVLIYPQTDEFRQASELIRRWYQAGYAPQDVAQWGEMDAAWTAGQYAVRVSDIVKPGGNAETEARWGWAVASKAIAEPLLTTGSVTATLNGISSTSANPELAVRYLELVNTDPVFFNTLCKGLEGVHWEWADQDQLLVRPANGAASFGDTGYNPNTDWMFGNVFNSYYTDPTQVGAWPQTAELNRNARPSPVLGFTFDRTPVETEIASISAVRTEFGDPLGSGVVDVDEGLARLNQALLDAGIERVRDEMQRQIDAWKSA
ncbi:MAG: ABC transporter substrate-binding protein [Anaerolineae bacterium]|nr:ABC transporter substrate-binding protein [Anaerolineae bacterium]